MRDINILKNTNFFSSLSPTLKDGRKIPARDHPQWLFHLPRLFFFFYLSAFTIKFEKKNETPEFNRKRKRAQVFSKALLAPPHPGNQELPQPKAPF